MKLCRHCGTTKPLSEFYVFKRDGVYAKCKACCIAYQRQYNSDPKRREHVAKRYKKWREANRDSIREYVIANREVTREAARARSRAFYVRNKSRVLAESSAWRKANRELTALWCRNRYARKKAAEGSHTLLELKEMYAKQDGCCAICGIALNGRYHADHIVPLARGGSNYISNIQILCATCNTRKSDLDPDEFMRRIGRLL